MSSFLQSLVPWGPSRCAATGPSTRRRAGFFSCFILGSLQLLPQLASGEDAKSPPAEALFLSAREAADAGDWKLACQRFEESYRLEAAPGTVLNLARCREQLGQLAQAWLRYGEVIERTSVGDERADYARRQRDALYPRVPKLVLLAPELAENRELLIFVNGAPLGRASLGLDIPVDPGSVELVIRLPQHEDAVLSIKLQESERRELVLSPGRPLPERVILPPPVSSSTELRAPPSFAPASEQPSSELRWVGYWGLGIGGAGALALGSGLLWAKLEANTVDAHCVGQFCDRKGYDASQRGQSANTLSLVGAGVAALGLGFGLTWLSLHPGASSPETARPRASPSSPGAQSSATSDQALGARAVLAEGISLSQLSLLSTSSGLQLQLSGSF